MKFVRGVVASLGAAATATVSPLVAAQEAAAPGPAASASAPTSSAPAASAPSAAASAASAAATPAGAASSPSATRPREASDSRRIEVTGGRSSDTEERRRSTAAKIVIGREEIEKFGDASVAEVLRRLPGVTTPGAPGRGGPPRLRGLGSGYTQILIDGQRLPPGFSLDSLTPEQLERIEILRAPTAETGARAIAGTINIITREGFRRRLNDVRLGAGFENGALSPGINVVRNDSDGNFIYNVSLAVFHPHRVSDSEGHTLLFERDSGNILEQQDSTLHTEERRTGVALTSRLQWRLGDSGDSLQLMPNLFHNEGRTERAFALTQGVPPAPALPPYDSGESDTTSRFTSLRLNTLWRQRVLPDVRMELNGGAGQFETDADTQRNEFRTGTATPSRTTDDLARVRERSLNLTAKFSGVAGGGSAGGGASGPDTSRPASVEHSLVGGVEVEGVARTETRVYTDPLGGAPDDATGDFEASTLRLAAYLQDEWSLDAHWAFHFGLRWEGITTRGDAGDGTHPTNRSSVTTPLLHLLWKPDPARRDQVRLSLTRSYRAPATSSLIGRVAVNSRTPLLDAQGQPQTNDPANPDTIGNPQLQPERAIGIDLAFERYLDGGGLLSANAFHRRISDLMRRVTTLETVSYSPMPRWVARDSNIGDATTTGLELEAKYRLDQLVPESLPVELRHNLAFYRSRVEGIPGPDNRLDQQAKATANFGADYRLRSVPLTLGGNLNLVPGYRTQLADDRAVTVSTKRVFDLFALWTFSPAAGLRLLVNNAAPRGYFSQTDFDFAQAGTGTALRETTRSGGTSYTNWQLRLELRL